MKNYRIGNYTRISKARAEKLFNAGKTIHFCPVNLRPGKPYFWGTDVAIIDNGPTFQQLVNRFEYYNCTCNETGRYTAFYIMEA